MTPTIFEVGGVYTVTQSGRRGGPGQCLTAAEIQQQFGYEDVSALPSAGPWFTGGHETDEMALERVRGVAAWLRSKQLHDEVGDRLAVMVVHGAFINILFHELLAVPRAPGPINEAGAKFTFPMPNTGTSLFTIAEGTGECTVHWIGRVDHNSSADETTRAALSVPRTRL